MYCNLQKMQNLLYAYLHHEIATFKTTVYNFDTLGKETKWMLSCLVLSFSQMLFLVPFDSCTHYRRRFVTPTSDSGCICFVIAFPLHDFFEYMYSGRIIETKLVPGILIKYEKQSDIERSNERQINVQQIFIYTKTDSSKTYLPLKSQSQLQQMTFINTFSLFFRENKT